MSLTGSFLFLALSDAYWGKLSDHSERQALLDPLQHELDQLDDQLAAELRVRDLAWSGATASLRAVAVALDAETAARPATALAQAARDGCAASSKSRLMR